MSNDILRIHRDVGSELGLERLATAQPGTSGEALPSNFDPVDQQIIGVLQKDGRASYQSIADAVRLSRPSVRSRMQRLLDHGLVQISGVVHPTVFGLNSYAHLAVSVFRSAVAVAESIAQLDDVPFVAVTSGACDLEVEIRTHDQATLDAVISGIAAMSDVRSVQATIYTRIIKDAYHPPQPHAFGDIDETDRVLLHHLQENGRASFVELGERAEISPGGARKRVLRLLSSGVVHVGARIHPDSLGTAHFTGFGLSLGGDDLAETLGQLADLSSVEYLAATIGTYQAVGAAIVESPLAMAEALDEIRALPGVTNVATWTYLKFVKESYARSPLATVGRNA